MATQLKCRHCGFLNSANYYLCHSCGQPLSEKEPFEAGSLRAQKIKRVIDNLPRVPHKLVPWDSTIDACVSSGEKIDALLELPELKTSNTADIRAKIDRFYDQCHNPNFEIAFVGTIKTGKSTLINALLGRNYASMAVTPETAALTKFRSSVEDYVKVTFYTREEWEKLWKSRTSEADVFEREYNELHGDEVRDQWVGHETYFRKLANHEIEEELIRWSSSKNAEHFFVKEIEVGISTLVGVPPQVVFVDTPGLSDPVPYRSELTREYIKRANAVLVCVEANKLEKTEIDTIASVFSFSRNKKNNVFIVATHWDKLNDPENDWPENRRFYARSLTGPAFYATEEEAESHILHSSAHIYNLARDYPNIKRNEERNLMKFLLNYDDMDDVASSLNFIQEKSNIPVIQDIIHTKLVEVYHRILKDDIIGRYTDIIQNVERITKENRSEYEQLLKNSYKPVQELEWELNKKKEEREIVQLEAGNLKKKEEEMSAKTAEMVNKICDKIWQQLGIEQKSGMQKFLDTLFGRSGRKRRKNR